MGGPEKQAQEEQVKAQEEEVKGEEEEEKAKDKAPPPTEDAQTSDAKIAKAHQLRKKAREALRKEGKPMPSDLEKGGLQKALDAKKAQMGGKGGKGGKGG